MDTSNKEEVEKTDSVTIEEENGTAEEKEDNSFDLQRFKQTLGQMEYDENNPPPLTWKEMKALKRARYHEIIEKFNKAFLLKNRRTGQVVEIRAASAFHACKIIGWKPNRTKLLGVTDLNETEETNSEDNGNEASKFLY